MARFWSGSGESELPGNGFWAEFGKDCENPDEDGEGEEGELKLDSVSELVGSAIVVEFR